ncbi:MAG TPA: MFS transporter, partial [Candidatus Scatomorpha pullistercoris]|nr:MFS transporter [Candidatus Scatomorpha pullistercoris]
MSMKKYYPTAFALYMTYFVLGVAGSIMGQYKQELASLWGSGLLADGTYDVSGVLAVIAALGLGRLISYPFAGPISDRFGRRVPALVGCALYFIFFAAVCYTHNFVLAYILGIVSGAANGFLDVSITPSCMEIFKEKGTIANIFTKLSISIAQFLLPFAIGFVAER